jgi:hypothetical protein
VKPDSGLIRSTVATDQNDPSVMYLIVLFESEEKAREREQDPRRREGLKKVGAIMAEVFEPGSEFVDLEVVEELQP